MGGLIGKPEQNGVAEAVEILATRVPLILDMLRNYDGLKRRAVLEGLPKDSELIVNSLITVIQLNAVFVEHQLLKHGITLPEGFDIIHLMQCAYLGCDALAIGDVPRE